MRVIIHSCGVSCNVESCSAEAGSSRFMQMLHPSLFEKVPTALESVSGLVVLMFRGR